MLYNVTQRIEVCGCIVECLQRIGKRIAPQVAAASLGRKPKRAGVIVSGDIGRRVFGIDREPIGIQDKKAHICARSVANDQVAKFLQRCRVLKLPSCISR